MDSDATTEPNLDRKTARTLAKTKPGRIARKTRSYRQFKRPAFVAAVLSRRAAGESGRAIAKELGVARATVERVLKQPGIQEKAEQTLQNVENKVLADFEQSLDEARTLLQAKIPDLMRMAVTDTLEKRDRVLAHEMVKRAGVYPEKDKPRAPLVDNRLQIAIRQLLPQPRAKASAPLTIESNASTEPAQRPVLETPRD